MGLTEDVLEDKNNLCKQRVRMVTGDALNTQAGTKKNVRLEFLKGLACFGVVFIHIQFPTVFGQIIRFLAGFAVPVFYMTAGYFNYQTNEAVVKKRLIKIIKILCMAYCYFLLYNVVYQSINHSLGTWAADNFNWITPIKYIVFCTIDFAIPLWYLIAMAEVYLCWLIIVKKGKEQAAEATMPVLFILRTILTIYCETMHLPWFWKINFATSAMPWFLLGYYLHSPRSKHIRDFSSLKLCILAIAGAAINLIPPVFDLPIKFNAIGVIPYSLSLFIMTLKSPTNSICKPIEFIGESLSLYIYVLHVVIAEAMEAILVRTGFDISNVIYLWIRPVIVLALSAGAAWVYYSLKKKRGTA